MKTVKMRLGNVLPTVGAHYPEFRLPHQPQLSSHPMRPTPWIDFAMREAAAYFFFVKGPLLLRSLDSLAWMQRAGQASANHASSRVTSRVTAGDKAARHLEDAVRPWGANLGNSEVSGERLFDHRPVHLRHHVLNGMSIRFLRFMR